MEALLPLMNMVIYSIDKAKKFRLNREVRLYFYYKLEPFCCSPLPVGGQQGGGGSSFAYFSDFIFASWLETAWWEWFYKRILNGILFLLD